MTWLLIVYLSTGGIKSVIEVQGPMACVYRATFEQRFDPDVSRTYCMLTFEDRDA